MLLSPSGLSYDVWSSGYPDCAPWQRLKGDFYEGGHLFGSPFWTWTCTIST